MIGRKFRTVTDSIMELMVILLLFVIFLGLSTILVMATFASFMHIG